MRTSALSVAILASMAWRVPAAGAGTTLVVEFGKWRSAEEAASAEAKVNWLDADFSDDTACTECFAAVELQRCLRRMSGRASDFAIADNDPEQGDLLLVLTLGSEAFTQRLSAFVGAKTELCAGLGPEGHRVKSAAVEGRRLTVVAGGGRVGTLYGAYELLHRLGCRWFAPGEPHEEVANMEGIPDLDVTERPAFLTRGFHAWEDRGNPDFFLWMARNRLNYWCVEQSNHPLLQKLGIRMAGGAHDAQARFLNPATPYPYGHPQFRGDEAKPKDPYPLSGQFQGDANKDGKLSTFEAHPEWFAFDGAKRIPGILGEFGTNYCTSNPHATNEFMTHYVESLASGPYRDADVVRFWTLDGGKWCLCPDCKALGSPTDRNLLLVHRLRQQIRKAQYAGKISRPIALEFLAYADVLQPPSRPLPPDFDYQTCYATFYPIVRCYVHRFDDPACPTNARYQKQLAGWATSPARHYRPSTGSGRGELAEPRGQLCIGEYYNVSGYKGLPIIFMHTMASDIPYYAKVGARRFHYMHVSTGDWGTKALTNYQMARQLWNPATDCEELWRDYFARRYGPAAPTMRRFYESLEQMLCNVSELRYGLAPRLNAAAPNLFPISHLRFRREPGLKCNGPTLEEIVGHARECRELIGQVLAPPGAAVPPDLPERIKTRIAEDERLFTYGERTVLYYFECAQAFLLARAGQRAEARPHADEARRLAHLLGQDTASATLSSSHANARNAFEASRATQALDHLAKLLGGPDERKPSHHE